jgi:hypothetical protein
MKELNISINADSQKFFDKATETLNGKKVVRINGKIYQQQFAPGGHRSWAKDITPKVVPPNYRPPTQLDMMADSAAHTALCKIDAMRIRDSDRDATGRHYNSVARAIVMWALAGGKPTEADRPYRYVFNGTKYVKKAVSFWTKCWRMVRKAWCRLLKKPSPYITEGRKLIVKKSKVKDKYSKLITERDGNND